MIDWHLTTVKIRDNIETKTEFKNHADLFLIEMTINLSTEFLNIIATNIFAPTMQNSLSGKTEAKVKAKSSWHFTW